MKSIPFLVLVLAALSACAANQPPASSVISVGQNVQLSVANGGQPHNEFTLATNPRDSRQLIACAVVNTSLTNNGNVAAYFSNDGGTTWRPTLRIGTETVTARDPACAYGVDGTAYVTGFDFGMQQKGSRFLRQDQSYVYHSFDGGSHWSAPTIINGGDRPFLYADPNRGRYFGRLYAGGNVCHFGPGTTMHCGELLHYSDDRGVTFHNGASYAATGIRYILPPGNFVVLPNGEIAYTFGELRDYWQPDGTGLLQDNTSDRSNALLRVAIFAPGGRSLEHAATVGDYFLQWPPSTTSGLPSIAVDSTGGPFHGRIYIVWPDIRSGRSEILFAYSSDDGKTWTAPTQVDDDSAVAPPSAGPDDFMPEIAVNKYGVVGVSWYDRRDIAEDLGWNERFAASIDGGDSFVPSVRVSSATRRQIPGPVVPVDTDVGGGAAHFPAASPQIMGTIELLYNFNGADTAGLAADANGVFHPAWIGNVTGIDQVWTARVIVHGVAIKNGNPGLAKAADVTSRLILQYQHPLYDLQTHTIDVDAVLINASPHPVPGTLTLRVVGIDVPLGGHANATSTQLGDADIVNADNGVARTGAIWVFPASAGGALQPGQSTQPRHLQIRIENPPPFTPRNPAYGRLGMALLRFKVLGQ